jgi:hypothetical protein
MTERDWNLTPPAPAIKRSAARRRIHIADPREIGGSPPKKNMPCRDVHSF